MKMRNQAPPYSLRLSEPLKSKAKMHALCNRRSLNAELGLLIEDGLKWRQQQNGQTSV